MYLYIMSKTIIRNDTSQHLTYEIKVVVMLITQTKQVKQETVLVHVLSDASILRQPFPYLN